MYYAKKRKNLGEPPYDTGSAVPSGTSPQPTPSVPGVYANVKPAAPAGTVVSPYSPYPASLPVGYPVISATSMPAGTVAANRPAQGYAPSPSVTPAKPAYTAPTQIIYADTGPVAQPSSTPVASNLPAYDPAVAAAQIAQRQAEQAAAAAQQVYVQPQYAPASAPTSIRLTAAQRKAQAAQRRREVEARRKQNKAAMEAAAKARRESQAKAQRKAQEEYTKQQKKAFEAQKRADEAYIKQLEAQEKAAQKQREEQTKLARKAAEQAAKQKAAQQQQYLQQQAVLQRQAEETRAKVEAAAQPPKTYAPISAPPTEYVSAEYPTGGAPPAVKTPAAAGLVRMAYITPADIRATGKQWGDGSFSYSSSSGTRLLQEIMRKGQQLKDSEPDLLTKKRAAELQQLKAKASLTVAEVERLKKLSKMLTPNQKALADAVLGSTRENLEKLLRAELPSKYLISTSASGETYELATDEDKSRWYEEKLNNMATTYNSAFNDMVQRVDLLQQMQNPTTAQSAYFQLQNKLTDEERRKMNQALASEIAPHVKQEAEKIASNASSGFFENLFASLVASPEAQKQGAEARKFQAQAQARQVLPGEGADLHSWFQERQQQPQEAIPTVTGWFPHPSEAQKVAERAALERQYQQTHYFDSAAPQTALETAVVQQTSAEQQARDAIAALQQSMQQQHAAAKVLTDTRDYDYFNRSLPVETGVIAPVGASAPVEQFVQSAWQQGMSPIQFNKHYGPGYPEALLLETEQRLKEQRIKGAEQIVVAAQKQQMSPEQFNQHYGPGYSLEEIRQAKQNIAATQASTEGVSGPAGQTGESSGKAKPFNFFDVLFGTTQTARELVSTGKLVSSPVSLLDPKNVGPKLFNLDRPGQTVPRVSAVPVDFLMRSGKDYLTPYAQEFAQSIAGPEYQQEARDAAAAGTKWFGKVLVDTPVGDTARTYATEYVFERGPIGNTFGTVAKNVGGKARGILQMIPGATQVGETSFGLLRTLLNPRVTGAGAIASGAYDVYRVADASFAAQEAMDAAAVQAEQTQRVQSANLQQMSADERKLATAQRALQHRISLYENAIRSSDFYVPAQSADHFRRKELQQQMQDKLPELKLQLEQTTQQLQQLRQNMQSQPAMRPLFSEEAKARAEAAAIDEANLPWF